MAIRRKRVQAEPILGKKKKVTFLQFLIKWNQFKNQTTPAHHIEIAKWLVKNRTQKQKLLMACRGASKSGMICLFIAWSLLDDPTQTFAIVSAGEGLATKNARFIKEVIQSHPWTEHLVPMADSDLWRNNQFNIARPPGIQENSVQALSLQGSVTGQRCHHAFMDDSEVPENCDTEENRTKLRNKLGEMRFTVKESFTWIGTPHGGEASIYVPMLKDPERYVPLVMPAYTDNEDGERVYLWPEMIGPEYCDELESANSTLFRTQMLLEIVSANDSGLPIDLAPTYFPDIVQVKSVDYLGRTNAIKASITITRPDQEKPTQYQIVDMLGAWDPARGNKDSSVLAVLARTKCNKTFVHRSIALPRINPQSGWKPQWDAIVELLKPYGVGKLYVETNRNDSIEIDTRTYMQTALPNLRVIGKHNTVSKETRVQLQIGAALDAGRLWVSEDAMRTDFAQQCRDFPANMKGKRKNDFIDAVAFGIEWLRDLPPGYIANSNLYHDRNRDVRGMTPGSAGGDFMSRSRQDRFAA